MKIPIIQFDFPLIVPVAGVGGRGAKGVSVPLGPGITTPGILRGGELGAIVGPAVVGGEDAVGADCELLGASGGVLILNSEFCLANPILGAPSRPSKTTN
jgi:hypothetical protein